MQRGNFAFDLSEGKVMFTIAAEEVSNPNRTIGPISQEINLLV